jgi:GNAT superfamily N-acetyltransferase
MKTFNSFLLESEFDYSKKSLVGDKGEKISTHGGYIDVQHKDTKYSPRKQSIVDFVVDDDKRGKGIGKKLVHHALTRHSDLGGQASSAASVKVLHGAGFRHPELPKGSVEDHMKKLHQDSSVYMAHKDDMGNPYI